MLLKPAEYNGCHYAKHKAKYAVQPDTEIVSHVLAMEKEYGKQGNAECLGNLYKEITYGKIDRFFIFLRFQAVLFYDLC